MGNTLLNEKTLAQGPNHPQACAPLSAKAARRGELERGLDARDEGSYRITTGAQAGRRVVILQTLPGDVGLLEGAAGEIDGFSLHGGVAAEAHESQGRKPGHPQSAHKAQLGHPLSTEIPRSRKLASATGESWLSTQPIEQNPCARSRHSTDERKISSNRPRSILGEPHPS